MAINNETSDSISERFDAKSAEVLASFVKDETESMAAIDSALEHLAWVLSVKSIPKDPRFIAAAAYASRVMQHVFGARDLLRSGNAASSEVVLRAALEATFSVGALANGDNFLDGNNYYLRLLFKSTMAKKKALSAFIDDSKTLSDEQMKECLEELAILDARLVELRPHQLSKTSRVAIDARMESLYVREYASQSRASHSDLETIVDSHVKINGNNVRVNAIVLSLENVRSQAAQLIVIAMETAMAMTHLLRIDIPNAERSRIAALNISVAKLYAS